MFDLKDKVIVVTGGNRGIGLAITKLLEQFGAKVASISKSGIPESEVNSLQIQADVTSVEEMNRAIGCVEEELGPIYGVVCNAGINRDGFFHKMDKDMWNEVLNVNLNGAFNTINQTIPKLYERKNGSVVFISSIVGESGNLGQVNYAASKAALIGLAKSLAKEGARYGVRSNVVAPGFTETAMTRVIPENVKEKITSTIPLRRFAKPEEIAWSVVFLLSNQTSSYITGEVIRVNGGQLM